MFRIPEGYSSTGVDELVDDIIVAAILEISAIQTKVSESNVASGGHLPAGQTHNQTQGLRG
jgi:hypothetical protein